MKSDVGIVMPMGQWCGWYFSEQLKFAHKHGYDIEIISGYKFNKSYNVFTKYVEEFYNKKSTTTDSVWRSISKSLLNNLLGRFGLDNEKSETWLVSVDVWRELLQYKKRKSGAIFIGDKVLATFSQDVSKKICDSHNVDFSKTFINDMRLNKKILKKIVFMLYPLP